MYLKKLQYKRWQKHLVTLCLCAVIVCAFSFEIMAKNTYIITDGDETTIVESYFLDCDEAIKQAGITMGSMDSYTQTQDGATSEISIQRANSVVVRRRGVSSLVITHGETAGDIVEMLDITLTDRDTLSLPPDTQSYNGMVIEIKTRPEPLPETNKTVSAINEGFDDLQQFSLQMKKKIEPNPETQETQETAEVPETPEPRLEPGTREEHWMSYDSEPSYSVNTYSSNGTGSITTPDGEMIYYKQKLYCSATAYTTENWDNKITATGTTARVGAIAVDPAVIPYGSKMFIVSENGNWVYGYATAEDCGGGIIGNKIDLFFDTYDECIEFGVRDAVVYVLEER